MYLSVYISANDLANKLHIEDFRRCFGSG